MLLCKQTIMHNNCHTQISFKLNYKIVSAQTTFLALLIDVKQPERVSLQQTQDQFWISARQLPSMS